MAHMCRMSPELTDIVIDYLHDHRPTLSTCGLVCRSWLPSSRFHLFSTLKLDFYFDFEKRFPILSSPDSTIPPYVRHLELRIRYVWEERLIGGLSMLPTFGALKSISLSLVTWCKLTLQAKNSLLNVLHGLKSLSLDFVQFDTVDEAIEFLLLVPSLERLSLGSTGIQNGDTSASSNIHQILQLKQITFAPRQDPLTVPLIHWLCLQPATSVHTVNFTLTHLGQIQSMSRYLKVLGPTLQHLTLSCIKNYSNGEIKAAACKEIDLAHNSSLRTITFEDLWMPVDADPEIPLDCAWIIDMLSRITSPFIKTVRLVICADDPQDISYLNLPTLAAFLSGGSALSAMQSTTLRFAIFGDVDRTEAIAAITESLPDLSKQNRLVFGGHSMGNENVFSHVYTN